MIQTILLDIEGTTTDIRFVHDVLFPYASKHIATYIEAHRDYAEVQAALADVQQTVLAETGREITPEEAILVLLAWIQEDRKHTALKTLQGLLWQEGYEKGEYKAHVYDEVPACLQAWKQAGIQLAIYSSGSVAAQKLLFGYSTHGDLTPLFSHYFDTHVGGKKETASYQAIAQRLVQSPETILFLSDIPDELDAAQKAGFQVCQVRRDSENPTAQFPSITSFTELDLNRFSAQPSSAVK